MSSATTAPRTTTDPSHPVIDSHDDITQLSDSTEADLDDFPPLCSFFSWEDSSDGEANTIQVRRKRTPSIAQPLPLAAPELSRRPAVRERLERPRTSKLQRVRRSLTDLVRTGNKRADRPYEGTQNGRAKNDIEKRRKSSVKSFLSTFVQQDSHNDSEEIVTGEQLSDDRPCKMPSRWKRMKIRGPMLRGRSKCSEEEEVSSTDDTDWTERFNELDWRCTMGLNC